MRDIELNKQLPVITMNFEEVKASLIETMEKYKGIVVTEEGLQDCKATQKELAGVRNKIDTYRKDVKKEMEKPIKEFESQCKDLIGLIADAEKPIKEGITVFDNKRREAKRDKAIELIRTTIEERGLDEKYASQLTVLDKYLVLNGSVKAVREDIEQRAEMLKQQQNSDKAKAEMLKATIESTLETVNTTIKTSLKYEDFEKYISFGWDISRIVREINDRAALVRKAEMPKEETKVEVREPVQMPVHNQEKAIEPSINNTDIPLYYVDVCVTHNFEMIQALSKFLKDNGYSYKVNGKGLVK